MAVYEYQKATLNEMLHHLKKVNLEQENEKQLKEQICWIFIANPSLKPEEIMIKVYDILQMDDAKKKGITL